MQRYIEREVRTRDEAEDRFKEWSIRKGLHVELLNVERAYSVQVASKAGNSKQKLAK